MLLRRGDTLAEQNKLASAYTAYKQAYAYDQTNEMARLKMGRMLERQSALSGASEKTGYDPRTGNIVPASAEVLTPQRPRSAGALQSLNYKDTSLKLVIRSLAQNSEQADLRATRSPHDPHLPGQSAAPPAAGAAAGQDLLPGQRRSQRDPSAGSVRPDRRGQWRSFRHPRQATQCAGDPRHSARA